MHFNAKWLGNRQKIRATPIRNCPYTLLYIVAEKNRNHTC
ncbi:Uncharacterised protein [Segatella copri]|nr:Uncharacterised protein [Segatella copri]